MLELAEHMLKRYLCDVIPIRVLSFDGCPNAIPAVDLVHELVRDLGVDAKTEHIVIGDEQEAVRHRFLGSPSIQIDCRDIEVDRREDAPLFGCRIYRSDAGTSGLPSREMIVRALREAASQAP